MDGASTPLQASSRPFSAVPSPIHPGGHGRQGWGCTAGLHCLDL